MGRDVPLPHDCPACHTARPIGRRDAAAARLAAKIARDRHAEHAERGDDPVWRPPARWGL